MVCVLDWRNPPFPGWDSGCPGECFRSSGGRLPLQVLPAPSAPLLCGRVDRLHALEMGADFLSSLLLFISKGFCSSSLGCIHFPSLLLQFIALYWLLYFYFSDLPRMHLDFGIFRFLKPCTLLLMISLILQYSSWLQVYFARPCFFRFHR